MSPEVFRAVLVTALLCTTTGFILLHLQERRHDREMAAYRMTGTPPRWHPDWDAPLDCWEQDVLDDIAANWNNAGLAILDGEGDGS